MVRVIVGHGNKARKEKVAIKLLLLNYYPNQSCS